MGESGEKNWYEDEGTDTVWRLLETKAQTDYVLVDYAVVPTC